MLKAALLSFIVLALDQMSKFWVLDFLHNQKASYKVTSFFNLVLAHNFGIAFGLLSNLGGGAAIQISLAVIALIALWYWTIQSNSKHYYLPLGFITGGALGNITDRLYHGAVVDFIDLHAFGWHYWTFNIADSFICIGAFLLIFL